MPTSKNTKIVLHFADEILCLLITFVGVMLGDLIVHKAKGHDFSKLQFSIYHIIISAVIAILVYGKAYSNVLPNDIIKEPFMKRISNALYIGVAWRSCLSLSE